MHQIVLDDNSVKSEPIDLESEDHGNEENKDSLQQELFEDSMAGDEHYADDPSMLGNEELQNLAGASGFQGVSFMNTEFVSFYDQNVYFFYSFLTR